MSFTINNQHKFDDRIKKYSEKEGILVKNKHCFRWGDLPKGFLLILIADVVFCEFAFIYRENEKDRFMDLAKEITIMIRSRTKIYFVEKENFFLFFPEYKKYYQKQENLIDYS